MKFFTMSVLSVLLGLILLGCGSTTKEIPIVPFYDANSSISGTEITVNVTQCDAVVTNNGIEKQVVCDADNTGVSTFTVDYRANNVMVEKPDGTIVHEAFYDYEVPAGEPDSLYMPNHGMDVQCPVGRRWCGRHTNCLKISVYGY